MGSMRDDRTLSFHNSGSFAWKSFVGLLLLRGLRLAFDRSARIEARPALMKRPRVGLEQAADGDKRSAVPLALSNDGPLLAQLLALRR